MWRYTELPLKHTHSGKGSAQVTVFAWTTYLLSIKSIITDGVRGARLISGILLQAVSCWVSEPGTRAPEIPNRASPCDWSRKQPRGGDQWPIVNYNLTRLNEGFTSLIWKHGEYFEFDDCIHCLSTHTELAKSSCSCESLLPICPLQMSLVWSLLWHAKSILWTDNQWWSWVWSSKYCFSIMTLGELHTLRA